MDAMWPQSIGNAVIDLGWYGTGRKSPIRGPSQGRKKSQPLIRARIVPEQVNPQPKQPDDAISVRQEAVSQLGQADFVKNPANSPGRPGLSQTFEPQSMVTRGPQGTDVDGQALQSLVSRESGMLTVGATGRIRSRKRSEGVSQHADESIIRV